MQKITFLVFTLNFYREKLNGFNDILKKSELFVAINII